MKTADTAKSEKLNELCRAVRALCEEREFDLCRKLIYEAMSEFPDAAQPHNLLGIVLEKEGEHLAATKHFRAAWALDPTYLPASQNLHTYGTFYSAGPCAFDESDVPPESTKDAKDPFAAWEGGTACEKVATPDRHSPLHCSRRRDR